jgi:hypothetical protein
MPQISKVVRDAVRDRMAERFGAALTDVATLYGVTPFSIDWSPATSRNFFQGNLHPDDLERTSLSAYPLVFLYTERSANRNDVKYSTFAGEVTIALDFHLSWRRAGALRDFESLVDAVEDATFETLNGLDWVPGFGLVHNGDLAAERSPIETAAEDWRQTIHFRLTFDLVAA